MRILIFLFSFALFACRAGEEATAVGSKAETVTLEVINSLAIPAHRVKIHLDTNGKATIEIQNRNEDILTNEHILEEGEMNFLQELARGINWKHVAADDMLGLDGTSVRIRYRGQDYSIWTPSNDTQERRLEDFLKLKETLFYLCGLPSLDLRE